MALPQSQAMIARERARLELERRHSAVLAKITPLAMATGIVRGGEVTHEYCLQVLTSVARNLCLVCSRRAGKTYVICCLLLLTALGQAECNSLYLALVSGQAKKVFTRIWKRVLRRFGIVEPLVTHSETEMVTTFWNGSTVTFGGVDDLRHVQTLLGDSMAGGLAVLDEAQSGAASVLKALVDDILSPMLDETNDTHPVPGRLIIAGTQPSVRAGYLHDLKERIKANPDLVEDGTWQLIRWSRFQNPFLTDNDKRLAEYLKKTGLKITDPIVRANWFGEDVYDENATAYRYRADRNQWSGTWLPALQEMVWFPEGVRGNAIFVQPPPGVDRFLIGLDPAATSDRFGIVLWGWSSLNPLGIWQCGEWVTEKAANVLESVYLNVIKLLCQHYKVIAIVKDAGSASTTEDPAFLAEWSLVIEPAKKGKGSKKARVDRLADLLGTGRAHILADSQLENDLKLARWDLDKRAEGKYDWTADCHPDVADAGTYPIPHYIEAIATKKKTSLERDAEREREAWTGPVQPYGAVPGDEFSQSDYDDTGYGHFPG